MTVLFHVIACGGAGTRLWPWSRESHPKQFQSFFGDETLLQGTARRMLLNGCPVETIVCGVAPSIFTGIPGACS